MLNNSITFISLGMHREFCGAVYLADGQQTGRLTY
jgi:hypothetical protein